MKKSKKETLPFKELREASGMTRTQFAEYFGIPYRTIQDWELGNRKCNGYVLDLMQFRLDQERKNEEILKHFSELMAAFKDDEERIIGEWGVGEDMGEMEKKCDEWMEEFKALIRADMERGGEE